VSLWPPGAREFVDSAPVARLATSDRRGAPHVVPICFALAGDVLYSIVDEKPKRDGRRLKRLRNLADNPRAAVVVDRYDDDWTRLVYALLRGRARIVDGGDAHARAVAALRAKYPQYLAMDLAPGAHPAIELTIEKVVFWRFDPSIDAS